MAFRQVERPRPDVLMGNGLAGLSHSAPTLNPPSEFRLFFRGQLLRDGLIDSGFFNLNHLPLSNLLTDKNTSKCDIRKFASALSTQTDDSHLSVSKVHAVKKLVQLRHRRMCTIRLCRCTRFSHLDRILEDRRL